MSTVTKHLDSPSPPEEQARGSPRNGVVPPREHRFKPGRSGNPKGRPAAGAVVKEWIDAFAAKGCTSEQLRKLARDQKTPWPKRAAAIRVLRTLETTDLADFEQLIDGEKTLTQLRAEGVNTDVIKKVKQRTSRDKDGGQTIEREVELHDRGGDDFDRVMDRTVGRPHQELTTNLNDQRPTTPDERAAEALRLLGEMRAAIARTN